jgi:hypothetical protein
MTILFGFAPKLVLQDRKVSGAVGSGHYDLAINDARVGADQECFVRDLFEAVGPIVAPTCEHPNALIGDMKLDTVPIELYFMHPPLAARHPLDR